MFAKMKTRTKILIGFGFAVLVTAFTGYFGISGMAQINQLLATLYEKHLVGSLAAEKTNLEMVMIGRKTATGAPGNRPGIHPIVLQQHRPIPHRAP